jgi:hypothetical protein
VIDPNLLNPFRHNVVQDAWQSPADVTEIHAHAFRACLQGITSAAQGVPDSLLIYGSAGSGKTHLLTRLQRHLGHTRSEAPDRALRCVFVFVRLQTAPQLLWQHVRRRLATDLMRDDDGLTQLQRLIAHQISRQQGLTPNAGILKLRAMLADGQETLTEHLRSTFHGLALPRDVCLVIEHLVFGRCLRDASAWLAGDSLPESSLQALGLAVDGDDDREDSARRVVPALCRLAGETLPIVFCFDQVEALQRTADDKEALFRFGRMAADLHDSDPNVFTITCLQSAVLDLMNSAVRDADMQRMAKRHVVLDTLTRAHVGQLIVARLESTAGLKELRSKHTENTFFPFQSSFADQLAAESPCVPRRVLTACTKAFDELQHGASVGLLSVEEFLDTELFMRQQTAKPIIGTADTNRIVLQGVQLLAPLSGNLTTDDNAGSADILIDGQSRVALSLRDEADGRALGPKLRALLKDMPRSDDARVVIVRDARLTIAKTAVQTRETLARLQERGAVLVQPTVEALVALEALESLLADAKSGDLANDGVAVHAASVLDWLRLAAKNLGLEPVEELMAEILGTTGTSPASNTDQDLAELLALEHVIGLEQASRRLSQTEDVLLQSARTHSEQFLVLEGPPIVLLDIAGTSARAGG